ncbi:ZG57 protein, partial [Trogon melanurus]|nr:ZG57 protein [Trogon melanurus]
PVPKIAEGQELYPCAEKGFAAKEPLLPPQAPPLGEQPFPCLQCGEGFCQKVTLLRPPHGPAAEGCATTAAFGHSPHLLGHLGGQPGLGGDAAAAAPSAPPAPGAEKPFICNQCGNSFGLWLALVAHQKTHAGPKPFPCAEHDKSSGD